jgi:putative endonuclease
MTGSATAARKRALRNQALGDYGERLAERHLVAQGMVVLDRNWRCEVGEIDLVMRDGDVLVVCEVKTRTTVDYGTPHEAVGPGKLDRLVRLATRWQEAHGLAVPDVRIDLVAVLRAGRGAATVDHVRGIG